MFSIRVAKAAEAKTIARIRLDTLYVANPAQISGAGLDARTIKKREAYWNARFAQAKGTVFIIESDGIIGFCDLIPSRDKDADPKVVGEIAAVYVRSEHWRMGAGKTLCYHVLTHARKLGYQALTLWALASNGDAMRFYESLGFSRDGAVKIETASNGSKSHQIRYRIEKSRKEN